ncbi:hypothetical protein [Viridibacillus arvi]|uniref:hypothetical protein n=1 Tax=Viridibacillus arvi TaxID=263475 RepID=UPI0034CF3762
MLHSTSIENFRKKQDLGAVVQRPMASSNEGFTASNHSGDITWSEIIMYLLKICGGAAIFTSFLFMFAFLIGVFYNF